MKSHFLLISAIIAVCFSASAKVIYEDDFTGCVNHAAGMVISTNVFVVDDSVFQQSYSNDLNEPSARVFVKAQDEFPLYVNPLPLVKGKSDISFDVRVTCHEDNILDIELYGGENKKRIPLPACVMKGWRIYSFALLIEGSKAKIFLAEYRSFKLMEEVDIGFEPESFNIVANAGASFRFTRLRVTDGDGLPDFSTARLYAARESIEQPMDGGRTAATNETVALPLDNSEQVVFILGATNRTATLRLLTDGKPIEYPVNIASSTANLCYSDYGYLPKTKIGFTDASIKIGRETEISVKPRFGLFAGNSRISSMGIDILRERDELPPASRHTFDLGLFKRADGGIELWVDGSFVTKLKIPAGKNITGAEIRFDEGVVYKKRKIRQGDDNDRFTILDFAANPRAKAFADAKIVLAHSGSPSPSSGNGDGDNSALRTPPSAFSSSDIVLDGIPMRVAKPLDSADLAICKQAMGNWWFEVDPYMQRSPQGGFPGEVHFRVPAAPYGRAGVLFAIDPDPSKEAIMTLRLGHFLSAMGGSGSQMLGDKTYDFTKGVPDWCRKVGEVEIRGQKVPLYFGNFQLNVGGILDEFTDREYLDFDVFGRPWENFQQLDNSVKPDPDSTSAISLFGVTLVKMPWMVKFRQNQIGNVYTVDEKNRGMTLDAISTCDNAYGSLAWRCTDVDGKEVFSAGDFFTMAKAGETNSVFISFGEDTPVGHYMLEIRGYFSDKPGEPDFVHTATFAIVPPAGRDVSKYKSPYATWWATAHGGPSNGDIGFPLITKMGVKRITSRKLTKEEMEKWDVTDNGALTVPKGGIVSDPRSPNFGHFQIGEEKFVEDVKKQIANHDRADHMLVWWESGPCDGVPEELLGISAPTNSRTAYYAMYLNEVGRIMRKHFPEIRLQIGNLSSSMSAASIPFRAGAKGEYYDAVGIETTGQTVAPEHRRDVGLLGMLAAQDVASRYAGRKVPVDGCLEFIGRTARNMGEEMQAEWNVRDNLICLAHNFHLISTAGSFDCINAYQHSIWGGGSIQRRPYYYTHKKYVSYSVFTKVFDGVEFSRSIETGSTTIYAVEFKRMDGKFVTAFWCARGEAEFDCEVEGGAAEISMFGKETEHGDKNFRIEAGGRATYLVSGTPLKSVKAVKRSFSIDEAIAGLATSEFNLADASGITVKPDPAIASIGHDFFPVMVPGKFNVGNVTDEEKGECVEVALDTSAAPDLSPYFTEYTTLRFENPIEIKGEPEVLGAWVKGDSNWGQLRFEIEDATGRVYKNVTGRIGAYADGYDWPGNMAVNFDGWSFVHIALKDTSLSPVLSPGRRLNQWGVSGSRKDAIHFPIKVTAITVGMNRRRTTLFGFEDKPAPATIRIKSVAGCGGD